MRIKRAIRIVQYTDGVLLVIFFAGLLGWMMYNKLMKIAFVITILSIKVCIGQEYTIDTVKVEGYLITFANKKDLKLDNPIDIISGSFFFTHNDYIKIKRKNYRAFFELDRTQNSVFLLAYGNLFLELNIFVFKSDLKFKQYDNLAFPDTKDFTFKDKDYFYLSTPVVATCLRIIMNRRDLFRLIALEQYRINFDRVPVYIIENFTLKN